MKPNPKVKKDAGKKAEKEKPKERGGKYDAKEAERNWIKFWEDNCVYAFDANLGRIFSIDTPPPYPSGDFHIGNVLNWCYFDFVARYKRMQGFNVHFPQGWDVHGLPTESKVEQWKGKKSSEVPREKWKEWCDEWTDKYVKEMKKVIQLIATSCDWSLEYRTSDKDYIRMIQLSFLELVRKGAAYRGKHPINWCPSCRTAIADAEVEYRERGARLYHLKFSISGTPEASNGLGEGHIAIATTRPELLPACVAIAVHPDDERYKEIAGRRAIVPLFGQEVDVIKSDAVDPAFGTGIVMICTFGDKQDVAWTFRHQLPIIEAIDEKGVMTHAAGKYQGIDLNSAKKEIVKDLAAAGLLMKEEDLQQNVGICWRCKTPIEIFNKEQWFLHATQFSNHVIEETKRAGWYPDHMKLRQIQWASSMDWDWVVSRQKVYGTPIPAWYCECGELIIADEDELPVDPSNKKKKCVKCGSEARGETDRFDTWMDSSMSNYWHAGWPSPSKHPSHAKITDWRRMIPADLQPNGADIIRTWDYYLMLRSIMLTGLPSYKNVMINGMVLGEDGRKMSKSLGNFITAKDALEKYSVDALRYWATKGAVGSDLPFSWKEVEHAEKFYNKIFNILQFGKMHLKSKPVIISPDELETADKWILTKLQKLVKQATKHLDNYQFNEAMNEIEGFVWHELADYYIEMIKHRLYSAASRREATADDSDEKGKRDAQFTLYTCLLTIAKLLAPFAPFITEEIYQDFFAKFEKKKSVHVEKWPGVDENLIDKEAEKMGEMATDIISSLRQYKTSRKMPLNAILKKVIIDDEELTPLLDDIKGTMKIESIEIGHADEITTERFSIGLRVEA